MPAILRTLIPLFLLLILGLCTWWILQRNREHREELIQLTTRQNPAVSVTVATARVMALRDSFEVNGQFEPWRQAVVAPALSGKVTRMHVGAGSYAEAGQTLLEIDNEYNANDLDAAEINLAQARKNVGRMENLIGEGGVTQRQYEEAKVQVESAEVKLNSLRKRMKDARVTAPISGYVTPIPRMPVPVENGFVGQGNPVFQLVDVSRVNLRVLLTAPQVREVRKGQQVEVSSPVFPGQRFIGKVSYTSMTADMLSKRYAVDIEIPNASGHPIRGGMDGVAVFRSPGADSALFIPAQALDRFGGGGQVYVVEGQIARLRAIQSGPGSGGFVSVLKGLQAGEQVVLSGQINLSDGAEVRIIGDLE